MRKGPGTIYPLRRKSFRLREGCVDSGSLRRVLLQALLAEGLVTRVSSYAKGRCLRFPCSQHTKLVVKPTEDDDLQHLVLDQHSFTLSICLSHDGEWGQSVGK